MLNAQQAAAKTAMAQVTKVNEPVLKMIKQRIEGAASAGLCTVVVEIEGNAFDQEAANMIQHAMIELGYQVKLEGKNAKFKSPIWIFTISW